MIKKSGEITSKRWSNSDAVAIIASYTMYPRNPQTSAVPAIKSQCSEKLNPDPDLLTEEEAMALPRTKVVNTYLCCCLVF